MCDKELLNSNSSYIIEKAFRRFPNHGEELIFEVAICTECAGNMRATLSWESLEKVTQFFAQKASLRKAELTKLSPDELLQTCLLSGRPLAEMEEYQVYAHCEGNNIAPMGGYYLLSGQIMEEIHDALSTQTKDELQRFSDDNLGTPPELQKLFSRGDILVI